MKNILKTVSTCPIKKSCNYFVTLNDCSNENFNITKRHSLSCYENNNCKSFLPYLRTLSPHFPRIRNYLRTIYAMIIIAKKISAIREALKGTTADHISFLKKTAETTCEKAKEFQYNTLPETLSECEILSLFQNAFISAEKRCSDIPRHPCISCERLCFRRQIRAIRSLRIPLQGTFWDELVHIKKNEIANGYICRTCLDNFRQNKLPAICILNGLYVYHQPEEIASLNTFEKVLIQRAKAFQVVTRMDTVRKNRSRVGEKIQKVKGRTFHLPLPLEETLEKLPNPEEIINSNSELFVLLRSVPTKRKVIWETLIDVKKVYNALKILKEINPLYKDINLPNSSNDITNTVKNSVFVTNDENINREKKRAIITEISLDEWQAEHLEYTIHALNETKCYETDSHLYKMLKVEDNPIDYREKYIDLLCFPDLYVNGMYGQFHERQVKLTSAEFIKCRLMSKHSQFRLNQQYLFYLLHDSNLRQLKQGIFHKLNTRNCTDRLTVEEYLKKLSEGKLEGDLTSIFAKLRNTPQYWTKPRNDVRCMTYHYGPATWFLTISPSEWNWNDLATFIIEMNPLVKNIHKKSTSELVAFDPVSASLFIDNRFQSIIDFILSPDAPLGKVNHYFFRREYQNRGLQHFHILLWVEEAPILGISSNDDVAKFIEKYLTCKIPDENICPTIYQRVKEYQTHKHNSYCLRNKKKLKKDSKKYADLDFLALFVHH